jgi:Phosphotransferase enzyme family
MVGVVDPQVKGTAVLTNPDALAELLGTADETLLGRPYLRWKPGTSCIAALELASGQAYAAAFNAAARGKLAKTLQLAPAGSILLVEQELCLLVARPSADRDLPALRDLAGALARVHRHHPLSGISGAQRGLVNAAGGVPAGTSNAALQTLAYKPLRRWVGMLSFGRTPDACDGDRYVLRAYRRKDLDRARSGLMTARRLLGGLAPKPAGHSRTRGLAVQVWMPGEPLDRALAARPNLADTLPIVGRALAGMHMHQSSASAARLAGASPDATAQLLGALNPDLGRWAAHLATRLNACRPRDDQPVFVHGDFSLDQVVLGPEGPVFLDWDRAGAGAAAVDLASIRASGLDAESWRRVLDGYGEVRPLPRDLNWYVASALLERAPEPFRSGQGEWLSETRRVLAHVRQLLA